VNIIIIRQKQYRNFELTSDIIIVCCYQGGLAMVTGACRVEMIIYEAFSLKDKRRVIKSILDKVRNKYNVSAAEIDQNDKWRTSVIGICTVSNNTVQVEKVLASVISFIERDVRVEITGYHIDII